MPTAEEVRLLHSHSPVIFQNIEMLDKVVAILDALETKPGLRLSEIVRLTGIPKPTCHRLLQVLLHQRLVWRQGYRYEMGTRLYGYAHGALAQEPVRAVAGRHLRALAQQVEMAALLSVRYDAFRILVAVEGDPAVVPPAWSVGSVAVIYAGAASKTLLAWLDRAERDVVLSAIERYPLTEGTIVARGELERELDRIRQRGWALSLGEREPETFSLAAPVFDLRGRIAAAVAVAAPLARYRPTLVGQWLRPLLECGRQISAELGFKGIYRPLARYGPVRPGGIGPRVGAV
jgi:DNA-binding IclR family transcriptional regulator